MKNQEQHEVEFRCNMWGDENGSAWVFEEKEASAEVTVETSGSSESYTDHELEGFYFSPDGWAVGIWTSWQGDLPVDADTLGDILRAVPAPDYDEEHVPQIPAG